MPDSLPKDLLHAPDAVLATPAAHTPDGSDWMYEIKFDGYRILAVRDKNSVRMYTRNGHDWTERVPHIADSLKEILPPFTVVDGEMIVGPHHKGGDFPGLQQALRNGSFKEINFCLFDLLALRGKDMRPEPLLERRQALTDLPIPHDGILLSKQYIPGTLLSLLKRIESFHLEGLIAKKTTSPYRAGRGRDWLKVKFDQREEFVIIGFTDHSKRIDLIGSLLLGLRVQGDTWWYCGKVGTGFSDMERRRLYKELSRRIKPELKILNEELLPTKYFLSRPLHVCNVEFTEWTSDGLLRHPRYQGIREDKKGKDVFINTSSHPFNPDAGDMSNAADGR